MFPASGLSGEKGRIVKRWRGKFPVCIVYPNRYYLGMSNLATHMLYAILNTEPDIVCERYFFDDSSQGLSLESNRPLSDFRILFFTLSYELDYINIPKILDGASIPVIAGNRHKKNPVVIAGGICAMANPEPIHSLFDLFIMGDIEATIPEIIATIRKYTIYEREDVVNELSSFPWVYNPDKMAVRYTEKQTIESFDPPDFSIQIRHHKKKDLGISSILTNDTEFAGIYLVEGTRGCPSFCPFCLMGNIYPFRYDTIRSLPPETTDVGIVGGGVSFHPRLPDIVSELKEQQIKIHLPSLRVDEVPISVIDEIKDHVKTLTFGVEAATEKMRAFIGKPVRDSELFERLEAILSIKPFNLKLYFMVGLYGEEKKDIAAIFDFVKRVKHIMVKKGAGRGFVGSVTVHASPFVPKASTPFQWLPMDSMDSLKEKIVWLRKSLAKVENTYFTHESVKFSYLQGILARGDRHLSGTLLKLAKGEGLQKIMRESPVNLNFYVQRMREKDEVFPWDFIKTWMTKKVLRRRLEKAFTLLKEAK